MVVVKRGDVWEVISQLHEKLKKLKRKRERLKELLAKEEEEKQEERVEIPVRRRKREWYEKFRWMFTSSGKLVIGGRDAKTNELLVRKYLEKGDIYLHADITGAPSVILKGGGEEGDIEEAAIFAASYSRGWKEGVSSLPVFWVPSHQVSLSPPSGEYRPRGGVIVRGERNWLKVPLRLYMDFDGERFYVSTRRGSFELLPGNMKKGDVARYILKELSLPSHYMDEVVSLLPPGGARVRKVR